MRVCAHVIVCACVCVCVREMLTRSATTCIASQVLQMDHQRLLVAYPCALIYGVFALLTIF